MKQKELEPLIFNVVRDKWNIVDEDYAKVASKKVAALKILNEDNLVSALYSNHFAFKQYRVVVVIAKELMKVIIK